MSGGASNKYENFTKCQMRMLKEISEKYVAMDGTRYSIAKARSAELIKMASAWEKITIFNFLQNCTSAAPILPGHLSEEYARRLRN